MQLQIPTGYKYIYLPSYRNTNKYDQTKFSNVDIILLRIYYITNWPRPFDSTQHKNDNIHKNEVQ